MGLLSLLQEDPTKQEALRQGLLNAGIAMMGSQSSNFLGSAAQGAGAGVGAYAKQFEIEKQKLARQQAMQAAMTPARSAVAPSFKVGGTPYDTLPKAQAAAAPRMTMLPKLGDAPLFNGVDSMMAGKIPQDQPLLDYEQAQTDALPIEEVPGQPAAAGGLDFNAMARQIMSNPDSPPEFQKMALEYYAKQNEAKKPITLGKSLIDPSTYQVIATDETWRDEQSAARQQRIEELNIRLDDQRLSREQNAELRRELAGEQAALRRDLASQSSADRRMIAGMASADRRESGSKPPSGYRYKQDGTLEPIPGGPAGRGNGGPMSVTLQKELLESDDTVQSSRNVVNTLNQALTINKKGYSGYLAKPRAVLRSNLPGQSESADATINLDNMMTGQALESLKSTFGAMPTEGERKILLEMQASTDKTPKQREDIINRAITAAQRREQYAAQKAQSIRDGSYLTQGAPLPKDQTSPKDLPKKPTTLPGGWTVKER